MKRQPSAEITDCCRAAPNVKARLAAFAVLGQPETWEGVPAFDVEMPRYRWDRKRAAAESFWNGNWWKGWKNYAAGPIELRRGADGVFRRPGLLEAAKGEGVSE